MLAGACCRSRRSSMALMPMETERPNDPIRADRKSARFLKEVFDQEDVGRMLVPLKHFRMLS